MYFLLHILSVTVKVAADDDDDDRPTVLLNFTDVFTKCLTVKHLRVQYVISVLTV